MNGNLSFGVSHLLVVFLLQRAPAQISHPAAESHPRVMAFSEVWTRSLCRPMEQLVDVEQEYPGGLEYIYSPACVPLWRCSGCCGDESLDCHPALERNITLEVLRINPTGKSSHYVELTFLEHQTCECRARQQHLNNESTQSIKNRARRRKHRKMARGCGKCQNPHI
ncbi:snake venom vascular endothelial growth factor toxin HF-like isoform X2 [Genypterus blacodes]|uniref:snake venom vascular endothelial growth factor toxin HF-like isoform X2 n=1 Tax=Genypterus blacodes TaxID=154954 RepID=UPI003F76FAED